MTSLLGGGPGAVADRTLSPVTRVLALVTTVIAVVVLSTWFTDPSMLGLISPGGAVMEVNAALCLLALSVSLVTRRAAVVAMLTGAAAAVGLVSLVAYAFGVQLGIEQLLVDDALAEQLDVPGRVAPATDVCLVLLAAARWLHHRGARRATQLLLILPIATGSVAQLGYLFQVEQLYSVVAYSTVAFPTALSLVLLSLAIACLVPGGVAWWVAEDGGAGATLVRHMLPVAVVLLPVLAVLPVLGLYTDVVGERFSIALMVTSASVVLLVVTAVAARRLDRIDRERLTAQHDLRRLNDRLREGRDLEWRRAERLSRDLQEERVRYQRAISKVDDLIWTVQVMPDGRLKPEFTSGDASGLYGGENPEAEKRDRTIPNRIHPDDRDVLAEFDDKIRAGQQAEVELRLVGYDDVVRWAWVRATPRRERDQLFADGISTNITERRQLAERREKLLALEQEQVRQLKQLNELRDELLAVTGHELRTPLAVILGYAELLLQEDNVTDVQRRHLEVMANRARQIALLVEDIFDLAKFSAGLATIEARPVPLHEVVTQAVQEHRSAADAAGLTIEVTAAHVDVSADPVRLRQVLDNLLSNAIKYSEPGGHVAVSTQRTGEAGDTATITVSDAGIGIPEDELEHIFDRMYRASSVKNLGIKGTGLGLAVAKVLVDAHAGTIAVANRAEGGACFTVELPVRGTTPV